MSGQKKQKKRLGEVLVEAGIIDEIQLSVALGMQKQTGLKIGKQLLKLGFLDEQQLSPFLKDDTDIGISLVERNITPKTVKAIPQDIAFNYKVMPVAFDGKTIVIATTNPNDLEKMNELAFRLGKNIHPIKALEWDIDNALLKYYLDFSSDELEKLTQVSSSAQEYTKLQSMMDEGRGMFDAEVFSLESTSEAETTEAEGIGFLEPTSQAKANEAREIEPQETSKAGPPEATEMGSLEPTSQAEAAEAREIEPQETFEAEPPKATEIETLESFVAETETEAKPVTAPPTQPSQAEPKAPVGPLSLNRPAPKKASMPAPKRAPAGPGGKPAPSTPTPHSRTQLQQALINLLIRKGMITEKEMLKELLRLERDLLEEEH